MNKTGLTACILTGIAFSCLIPSPLPAQNVTLDYSTYLGGSSNEDVGYSVVVDSSGEAYIGGYTNSTNFPTVDPYQSSYNGTYDAYLAKLSSSGSSLIYSTYLGGTNSNDYCYGMDIDSSGCAYLVGYTMAIDFPTVNPYQASRAGSADVFVTKFSSTGSSLVYSTYLGGVSNELARCIEIGTDDRAYVSGYTVSTNFPTVNPYQPSLAGNYDIFITIMSAAGTSIEFSTYFGGYYSYEEGYGIKIDADENIYVAGYTRSTDFPTLNSYQASIAGGSDIYALKFAPNGSSLIYSSIWGGDADDTGYGLAIDTAGAAYVVGDTQSTNGAVLFPTTAGAFQTAPTGGTNDVFVTKLSSTGSSLVYSTFLGGDDEDIGQAITIDPSQNVYVTGYT
ncbi:MAG TPA: SBBP repeat-containing protein, partial [bacterium]|nr:SBBP repeat-containing protein [bacterium]